jgi:hypothetical protein
MTQICLINDLHFGIKNDAKVFLDYQEEFYTKVFFPELKKRNITNVAILGDVFDKRKSVNNQTLQSSKDMLFDVLNKNQIKTKILVGNHCIFYKNTLEVNSPRLLLGHYDNVDIIDSPIEIGNILYLPWITDSNYEESMDIIKSTKLKYVFAHLELSGFEMNLGHTIDKGMDSKIFKKFDKVMSGHYHHRSTTGNVYYLGAQFEMTWIDHNDQKGFSIFDDVTGELELIKNQLKMFYTLKYDESIKNYIPNVTGKIIKVIVEQKESQKKFDVYLNALQEKNPFELKIVENLIEHDSLAESVDLDVDSTSDIIEKYIDECEISLDNVRLKEMFKELYAEAVLL